MNIAKLKTKAKKSLSKNYGTLLLAFIILIGLSMCASLIAKIVDASWLQPALTLIIDALFMLGFIKMINKTSKNKKIKINDLFSKTESFFKYIGIVVTIVVIIAILGLLEAIAFKSLTVVIAYQADINFILSIFLIILGLLLCTTIMLGIIYIIIAFSQVLFIANEEPKLSVFKVLSKSFDMMENYIIDYLLLTLSFIGWIILGIFTFGLLYLWVIPYMLVTYSNFYEEIKKEFDNDKEVLKIFNDKDAEESNLEEKEKKELKKDKKTKEEKTSEKKTKKTK